MEHNRHLLAGAAVVLDPHPVCQEGVKTILGRIGVDVVGVATWPSTALALVRAREPDLLVADVESAAGPADGLRCVRQAREHDHELAIVVLSANGDPRRVQEALAAGATAYVLKSAEPDEIAMEIERALAPSLFVAAQTPPGAFAGRRALAVADAGDATSGGHGLPPLTRRELEVLRLLEGRSNREVAKLLWVTDETVKFHLANIYRKLGVSSRSDAVAYARSYGLLQTGREVADAEMQAHVPLLGAWSEG